MSDDDVNELAELILDVVSNDIFVKSQENIIKQELVDEGTLLKSGHINSSPLEREIVYAVPYADEWEFGRVSGKMPPVDPIAGWVKRKLGINDESEARKIAWAIAVNIKNNGHLPRPFLVPAIAWSRVHTKIK